MGNLGSSDPRKFGCGREAVESGSTKVEMQRRERNAVVVLSDADDPGFVRWLWWCTGSVCKLG